MNWKAIAIITVLVISTMVSTAKANMVKDCLNKGGDILNKMADNYNNRSEEEQKEINNIRISTAFTRIASHSNLPPIIQCCLFVVQLFNVYKAFNLICA
jgi:hypothetical protein